jgi:glycerol-3-phosphate dehydrogenase
MLHPVDARVLFTLPNGDLTIFGTTEQATAVGQVEARATREDVGYLLAAANRYFPNAGLGERDVLAAWAGIRPLARTLAAGDLGSASREHTIERGPRGVVHVTGGKLTTYRSMAAEVVDALTDSRAPRHRSTADSALPGGERAPSLLMEEASRVVRDDAVRARLVSAYGTRWRDVWNATSDPRARERLVPDHPVVGAELVYSVSNEMVMTLGDLLIRRTRLAFVMPDQGRALAPEAARWVKPLLGWDADAAGNAVADYDAEVERVFAVK